MNISVILILFLFITPIIGPPKVKTTPEVDPHQQGLFI